MKRKDEIEVSILIPTFNRDKYIKRAIDSSLNQEFPCEVLVCDHGSSDNTEDICLSYGERITYVRRDKDFGIHFCELDSIISASGKYIHFCFDDDWMHPKFIKECMKLMRKDVGVVFSNHEVVNLNYANPDEYLWPENISIKNKTMLSISKIPYVMTSLISPSAAIVRKEDALQCMYMTKNLMSRNSYNGVGPDWLITAMPLFRYKKCGYITTPLIKFGDHGSSITMDALNDIDKINRLRAAYNGARIYLLVSSIIRLLRVEDIYFQLEKILRKTKNIIEYMIKSAFK